MTAGRNRPHQTPSWHRRRRTRHNEERWWAWPVDHEAAELLGRAQRQHDSTHAEEVDEP